MIYFDFESLLDRCQDLSYDLIGDRNLSIRLGYNSSAYVEFIFMHRNAEHKLQVDISGSCAKSGEDATPIILGLLRDYMKDISGGSNG